MAHFSPAGQLTSCNAGYPAPLWVPTDDSPVVRLVSGGPAIGSASFAKWDEEHLRMLGGDIVVAVSDGVLNAQNVTGQPYGDEQLIETVCEFRRHPLDVLVNEVIKTVRSWTGRELPTDDLSVLAVRYQPEG
jgi:sigma-B regulation protein RsbU (phosphoserine phosphatase)